MRDVVATIRLAPGEVGFYDEYTRIHLTYAKPEAFVFAGMNVTQIRNSVRSGRLLLKSGTLGAGAKPVPVATPEPEVIPVVEEVVVIPEPIVVPEPIVEEIIEETPIAEEVIEEIQAEEEVAAEPAEETTAPEIVEKPGKRKKKQAEDPQA